MLNADCVPVSWAKIAGLPQPTLRATLIGSRDVLERVTVVIGSSTSAAAFWSAQVAVSGPTPGNGAERRGGAGGVVGDLEGAAEAVGDALRVPVEVEVTGGDAAAVGAGALGGHEAAGGLAQRGARGDGALAVDGAGVGGEGDRGDRRAGAGEDQRDQRDDHGGRRRSRLELHVVPPRVACPW